MADPRDLIQRLAATPEPASGPTRRQIMMLAADMELGDLDGGTRLVLEAFRRWGHQPPQPIPTSERLPEPEDCHPEEGWCWAAVRLGSWVRVDRKIPWQNTPWLVWLPYYALPLPHTPTP